MVVMDEVVGEQNENHRTSELPHWMLKKSKVEEEIKHLQLESKLFSSALERLGPVEDEMVGNKKTAGNGTARDGGANLKKKRDEQRLAAVLLTTEQKLEISIREMEDVRTLFTHKQNDWEKEMEMVMAELEEFEIRIGEVKKDAYEFKRGVTAVTVGGQRSGKIVAEKVVRFHEDKLRDKVIV